ncbi:MAG: excinuclease ABC subunit UvrC [Candidatus Berkelbacteria bacterium]|nr:excinuclease ABC subunit UvrC [Candidatus Berkelbacteria bacterium]MCR4307760.1 excinuclease ABC subunit UvrC [Candidatus Berkelbacteria bacterium]
MKKMVQNLPTKPGVYLFKDESGAVLYVGKAKNLRNRVGSYFTNKHLDRPWVRVMIGLIDDIETIVVNNELEALILEARLIGEYLPKYNIKLTDDKAYPFIKLTVNELFPRFQIVRQRARDGAKYFGPYLSAWSARLTCEFLRRLYGVHISNRPLPSGNDRPCLNCQLENNLCPLTNQISKEAYASQVAKSVDFLLGKRNSLSRDLSLRMDQASEAKNYELAAKLRDQLRAIRQVTTKQHIVGQAQEDFDVIATAKTNTRSVVSLLTVRQGVMSGQRQFVFDSPVEQAESEVIRQFFLTLYTNLPLHPSLIILETAIDDQKLIEEWLETMSGHSIELRVAKRGDKIDFVALAKKNAGTKLESSLVNQDSSMLGVVAIKELLGLYKLPQRIEAVDISNLGVSEPVGATVCFINGTSDKNEYRRYKIKTVEGQDDFAMITEVTARRFADSSRPLPDLFVVDGGPEQLKAAISGYQQSAISNQPGKTILISLAKKPDRVFLPGKKKPIPAPRGHKGVLLLARIRDETHRFVISFHRQRQRKKSLKTIDS